MLSKRSQADKATYSCFQLEDILQGQNYTSTKLDDLICKTEIQTETQSTDIWIARGKKEGGGTQEELGDRDCHIYTVDN